MATGILDLTVALGVEVLEDVMAEGGDAVAEMEDVTAEVEGAVVEVEDVVAAVVEDVVEDVVAAVVAAVEDDAVRELLRKNFKDFLNVHCTH